jgi:hypothetical protein
MDNFSESFNRTKLLINYDVSKTLSENQVKEQYYPYNRSYTTSPTDDSNRASPLYVWMKTWDTHDWFSFVQLILLYLGFVTGGVTSVISFALDGVVSVAEAIVYFTKDKDPYMGVVMGLLSLLGMDDIKRIPIVKKYGIEGTAQLLRKQKEGIEKLTKEEIDDLKLLGKYVYENIGEFIPLLKKSIKSQITKYLSKKSIKWLLNLLIVLNKTKKPLLVAGTWIAFDHFYIYVFRDDIKKMKLRNENTFIQIVKYVETLLSGKEINNEDFVKDNIPMDSTTLVNNLAKVDTTIVDTKPILDSVLRAQGVY